ncbi:unnamed protein product [Tetraodon nigroviridis]|uniref:(spotted green pufferfish) hypothetical protein n=1 Tax=Tetraodon nigroviridis TaxID=99883 RepID=Q4T942_TETNG|nr:unnamed protein product [Tetraodon nigroviridis]
METQASRFREHLPRGRTASGSAPGPGAQRTQRSVGSLKRRRWGALHVRIAWKIYHHKQLKRIQQKCIGGRAGVAPERPSNLQPGPKSEDEAGAPLGPPSPPRPKRKRLRRRDRRTGKELPGDTGVTSDPDSPGGRDPIGRGGLSDSSWSSRTPGPRAHALGALIPASGLATPRDLGGGLSSSRSQDSAFMGVHVGHLPELGMEDGDAPPEEEGGSERLDAPARSSWLPGTILPRTRKVAVAMTTPGVCAGFNFDTSRIKSWFLSQVLSSETRG